MNWRLAGLLVAAVLSVRCGDSPSGPTDPPPPPPNTAPIIRSLTASVARTEVGAQVDLAATVDDAETPVAQLRLEWAAEAGTFSGSGASVKWQAPTALATPANYILRLTVVESYQARNSAGQLETREHRVTGEVVVRVHDSPKELGDMGLRFLGYFANSSLSPEQCVVDFSDGCSGKAGEIGDIEQNREFIQILSHSLGTPRVTYVPGSSSAEIRIRTAITDKVIKCDGWPWDPPCVVNQVNNVVFDGYLTGIYEQGRWWLCRSEAHETEGFALPMRYRTPGRRTR